MGELRTRKRGKTWEWSFEGARIGGKRNPISKGGYRTKTEALAAGTAAKAEYDNAGTLFKPSEISVSDFYDMWLQDYCRVNLKETTYQNYRKRIDLHIRPELGKYSLKALSPATIQKFLNQKFNEGYSRNTLSVIKGLLTGPLDYAVEPLKLIKYNPALCTKLPSPRAVAETPTRKKERTIVKPEQWKTIITRFPEGHSCHIPLQLAYRCGLRLGETFALSWDDIDFDTSTLTVNNQIQNIEKVWTFTPPKYDSRRTIELDSKMLALLSRAKIKMEKAKDYYAEYYTQLYVNEKNQLNENADGRPISLVNQRENGTYIQPRVIQHCSRIIHYQLDIPDFDYHSLRHTHATTLLEAGANPKDVQKRLGHRHIQETMDIYAHATPKMAEKTISIMETIE